jgi:hypothetical protein
MSRAALRMRRRGPAPVPSGPPPSQPRHRLRPSAPERGCGGSSGCAASTASNGVCGSPNTGSPQHSEGGTSPQHHRTSLPSPDGATSTCSDLFVVLALTGRCCPSSGEGGWRRVGGSGSAMPPGRSYRARPGPALRDASGSDLADVLDSENGATRLHTGCWL